MLVGVFGLLLLSIFVSSAAASMEYPVIIDNENKVVSTINAFSEDAKWVLTVKQGTEALDKAKKPIESLMISKADYVITEPSDMELFSAYKVEPYGVSFSPSAEVVIEYTDEELPGGTEIVVKVYDNGWTAVPTTIKDHKIVAEIDHSGVIGVFVKKPENAFGGLTGYFSANQTALWAGVIIIVIILIAVVKIITL